MDSSILPFFKPKGVVVIGASTSPEKLGYGVGQDRSAREHGQVRAKSI